MAEGIVGVRRALVPAEERDAKNNLRSSVTLGELVVGNVLWRFPGQIPACGVKTNIKKGLLRAFFFELLSPRMEIPPLPWA